MSITNLTYLPLPDRPIYEFLNQNIPFPSGIKHQIISLRIAAALLLYVQPRDLGHVFQAPCDVVLSRECTIQPDIVFVQKGRSGLIGVMNLRGAPDLIVEILSRDTHRRDLAKRKICLRFEVKEYWAVDSDSETVEVLLWSELGYASNGIYSKSDYLWSPTLPKLRLSLRNIFWPRVFTNPCG